MGYSQSGITRMIESLEQEVGFPLLIRSKKGVVLTENGRKMLPYFRDIVRAYRSMEQTSADVRGTVQGSVTIGSYYSVSANLMPQILSEFQKRYPGVSVRIQEGSNLEMAKWLKELSVDCCFSAQPSMEDITWIPLMEDEIVAWLPKSHPLANEAEYPLRNLEEEPFIYTSPNRDTELDRLIETQNLNVKPSFTTKDGFTTYNMVAAGLGVSFNQRLLSGKWSGEVVELPFNPPQFVELGIALPSRT